MEGNQEADSRIKNNTGTGLTFGYQSRSAQPDPGTCSRSFGKTIDVCDDFFNQEGFSYTRFLLGDLSEHQPLPAGTAKVSCQGNTAPKRSDATTPPEAHSSCKMVKNHASIEVQKKQQKKHDDSSSELFGGEADNPWDISMFDSIQLDEIDGEGAASNRNEETETTNENSEPVLNQDSDDISHRDVLTEQQQKNISEKDIDDFLSNEKIPAEIRAEIAKNEIGSDFKPEIGMEFETREDVQKFFNMYSYVVGFSVSCVSVYRTQNKKRNNEVIRFTMKCNKYGHNTETERELIAQRQTTVIKKTDCKVEMVASEKNGVWQITGLTLLHNHELSPQSRFFRSHIYMSDGEKELVRTMKHCNMPTRDMVAVLAFIRGGMAQLPYNKKKVSNYSHSINRDDTNNDMMEVLDWFIKKREENPGFYHAIEADKNSKVRSVFWADARARLYYEICGDCISFDTTFLTNRYNLPFAPFVGVSPHANTYMFGCALIINESADTFAWLFTQFLLAMGGKHPISIITDADRGMGNAIPRVFLNATHRGCLFHVKKKIDDKGGTVFKANDGLYEELQDIIDNSLTVHEYETLWQEMIAEHGVGNVKVFQDLWKTREKWVPVYFKSKFFPFIQTTARSEGTEATQEHGANATQSTVDGHDKFHGTASSSVHQQ
ncbi:unnamed protein product [Alopecurus aequalis]